VPRKILIGCINGCDDKHYSKGMCKKCYERSYSLTPKRRKYILERVHSQRTREYYKRYNKSDRIKNYHREYQKTEEYKKKVKEYRNSDRWKEIRKAYAASPVGRASIYNEKYRRKSRLKKTDITYKWLLDLRNNTFICDICKKKLFGPVHLDHIIPLNIGGKHLMNNVRYVHMSCNVRRPHDGSDINYSCYPSGVIGA
jgi:hypothetical protein